MSLLSRQCHHSCHSCHRHQPRRQRGYYHPCRSPAIDDTNKQRHPPLVPLPLSRVSSFAPPVSVIDKRLIRFVHVQNVRSQRRRIQSGGDDGRLQENDTWASSSGSGTFHVRRKGRDGLPYLGGGAFLACKEKMLPTLVAAAGPSIVDGLVTQVNQARAGAWCWGATSPQDAGAEAGAMSGNDHTRPHLKWASLH